MDRDTLRGLPDEVKKIFKNTEKELSDLNMQIATCKSTINQYNSEIVSLEKRKAELDKFVTAKEEEILGSIRKEEKSLTASLSRKKRELEEVTEETVAIRAKLDKDLKAADDKIKSANGAYANAKVMELEANNIMHSLKEVIKFIKEKIKV